MKRFTDTDIWIDRPWFIELEPIDKCAFMFIKDRCDNVGVWVPNFKLAEVIIGSPVDWKALLIKTNENITVLKNSKWWLHDMCNFQYGKLDENCRPHQSYIKLLKKHGLLDRVYKGYTKGINTLKDKDKDKDLDKEKDKSTGKHKYGEYFHVSLTAIEYQKLQAATNNAKEWIKKLDEYIQTTGKKYKDHYLTMLNWYRKENKGKSEKRNPHVKALTCPDCGEVITGPFCRKCGWIQE